MLEAVRGSGIPIAQIDEIVHGHTTGINAVLSRQGAKTALLATAGHRDLLDLGRMDRAFGPTLYDPTWMRPHQAHPLVRRRDRYGARERVGSDGAEIRALDEDQVRTIAREVRDRGINSGWGDPLKRATAKVLLDVEDGVYSARFVEKAFGVVIDGGAIDEDATRERRAILARDRANGSWTVPSACSLDWTGLPRITVEASA